MFKNRGWTEKAYVINFIIALAITQEVLIMACLFPLTDFGTIATAVIPAVFAEVSVFSGFVIWKNKNENINKHKGVEHDTDSNCSMCSDCDDSIDSGDVFG